MKKLIILDYFFGEGIGHFERYDLSIANEALRQRIKTEIWCPIGKEQADSDLVQCRLKAPSRRTWKDKGSFKRLLLKAVSVIPRTIEFRSIFKNDIYRDSVILIPEIENLFYLYLLPIFFGTLRTAVRPQIVIIIRRDMARDWGYLAYLFPNLCRLLTGLSMNYLGKRKNVSFVSDSDLITEELRREGNIRISTVPIPHLPPRHKESSAKAGGKGKVIIGYFGGARLEQGFDLVPATIKGAFEEAYPDLIINFIVQTGHEDGKGRMGKAFVELSRLKEAWPERIEIMSGYLTSEEYEKQMSRCHIILIPYRREEYGNRTSGILTEAIACGAWSIVPSGTWMAKQKEKYEKIITFDELDAKTLVDAIGLCLKLNKEIDADEINRQIDNWYAFHSPSNYLDAIRSLSIGPSDTA